MFSKFFIGNGGSSLGFGVTDGDDHDDGNEDNVDTFPLSCDDDDDGPWVRWFFLRQWGSASALQIYRTVQGWMEKQGRKAIRKK